MMLVDGGPDEWTYRYKDIHYSKQKITDLIPGKKVVWHVLDSYLNFIEDKTEWNGTKITFDISKKGDQTEVRFSHMGLTPEVECYDACTNAWGGYVNNSLRNLISKGKGRPNRKEKAVGRKRRSGPSRLGRKTRKIAVYRGRPKNCEIPIRRLVVGNLTCHPNFIRTPQPPWLLQADEM